jgi:hypothetical protein
LDSGSNALLGVSFADNAPEALDVMLWFLDKVFYPQSYAVRHCRVVQKSAHSGRVALNLGVKSAKYRLFRSGM